VIAGTYANGYLAQALVEMADTLVDEFDVIDVLTHLAERCVDVLGVSAAGLLIVSPEGKLRVVASSNSAMRVVGLFELQSMEGPSVDCFRTGEPVLNRSLNSAHSPWPLFAPVALGAGFQVVHALPMRQRGSRIGVLNLFRSDNEMAAPSDVVASQALADMATIAIFQNRVTEEIRVLKDKLNMTLQHRTIVEQATDLLAKKESVEASESFVELLTHVRDNKLRLADLAQRVIDGSPRVPGSIQ
jgi:GAF domain-containing protein